MNYYVLTYEVVEDYVARRAAYRDEHLRLANAARERGELILGGAFCDPVDRAMLVFKAASRLTVEDFARNDPYVIHGLVKHWDVRQWSVVVGNQP